MQWKNLNVVARETSMEIEIDESIWTPEAIRAWSKSFYDADDLSDVVEHVARLKSKYDDGEFIEGVRYSNDR